MKKIISMKGIPLEDLKVTFECKRCGCGFEAEYGDYDGDKTTSKQVYTYCPYCNRQVIKNLIPKGSEEE
jgi:Zn finger protein HypA/HybF involved in hydrogenase expression